MHINSHNIQSDSSIGQRDVWHAKKRIAPFVPKSPLIYSEAMSNLFSTDVYLKLEQFNPTASFKIRGATNKILSLTEAQKASGVATFSTGNFARSVAHVARARGIKAVVCISERVPEAKVRALEQMGAEVKKVGTSQDDAEAYCYNLEKEQGFSLIHPFDDPDVIAGQGTIGLEIVEDVPDVDMVIAGLSGGGLLTGLGIALKNAVNDTLRLIGISAERGATMYESIKAGKIVHVAEKETLADSLLGGIGANNQYTFDMVQEYVDKIVLVNEHEIADGMRYLLEHEQMITEGAAAAGVGAINHGKIELGKKVVIVLTGRSVDTGTILRLME